MGLWKSPVSELSAHEPFVKILVPSISTPCTQTVAYYLTALDEFYPLNLVHVSSVSFVLYGTSCLFLS